MLNDSDTEFIASNVIKPACNPDNASVLTPKANAHVVGEETTHTKELEKNKKKEKQEKNTLITWKGHVSSHS